MAVHQHTRITDEAIADLKRRIGLDLRVKRYNEVATRDAIRHFAECIGDINPLWSDETYASKTKYGGIIAPPCFLYSVWWAGGSWGGLPGIHDFNSGCDWEFYKPVRKDDTLAVKARIVDVVEKASRFAGRMVIQTGEGLYLNQRDEAVGKGRAWNIRVERNAPKEHGKYAHIKKAEYTPQQLKAIEEDIDREEVRGSVPRYWEDVKEGDKLVPTIKGPLSMADEIAWCMGAGSPYIRAHRYLLDYKRRHPAIKMVDSTTGNVDIPELVHMEESRAQEIGVPGAYDYGPQRISWMSQLVTNWMGDDGWLKRLYVEVRQFNVLGDTTWCKGKVGKKYMDGTQHLVDLELWAENQRNEITAPAKATVILPSRTL